MTVKYPTDWPGGKPETSCGSGSMVANMQQVIRWLPPILEEIDGSILELGCGDLNFAQNVLSHHYRPNYLGIDIKSRPEWAAFHDLKTAEGDITTIPVFNAKVIIARDVFIHLPTVTVASILKRIQAEYLIATTYPGANNEKRSKKPDPGFQPIDLSAKPFGLTADLLIQEHTKGKFLGVYKL